MPKRPGIRAKSRLLALWLATACCAVAQAASIEVLVVDSDRQPVPDVAVYVDPPSGQKISAAARTARKAVMDQANIRFAPHILVVQTGTAVEFPNSDTVAHHVYSFSKPNNFVLPLYKGDAHAPVTFSHAGVVILGCNIHDGMLGYIVVVDSGLFGITDAAGRIVLDLDAEMSEYVVNIWSPRIRDDRSMLHRAVSVQRDDALVTFELQKKLRPPHDAQSDAVRWSDY
jgi:plastocyanin